MYTNRLGDVPNAPKTPTHSVRVSDAMWAALGDKAAEMGTDRSDVLRQLAAWWLRQPGARLPDRPKQP